MLRLLVLLCIIQNAIHKKIVTCIIKNGVFLFFYGVMGFQSANENEFNVFRN